MRRLLPLALCAASAVLATPPADVQAQSGGTIVFVRSRPPRDFRGNLRAWSAGVRAASYTEDTTSHVWRVQFVAFLPRAPRAAEVTLVFYKLEGRSRRYISNESVALSSPNEPIFYHQTTLHRGPDEFQPMENYEVAIAVADARGQHELARGRIQLIGEVERRGNGVVDFTGANGPTVH